MSKSLFRFWSPILLVIVGWSSTASLAAPNPSFPCSKPTTPDEKAICQDQRLTTLDHIANRGYLFLRAKLGKAQANKINLPLIRQRQKCKADIVCIENAQRESIRIFNQNGAKLEIPASLAESEASSEQTPATDQQALPAPSAPPAEPTSPPEPVASSTKPATDITETAPAANPAMSPETPATQEKPTAPTDETVAAAAPASQPSAAMPETQTKTAEISGAPSEPVDQPPVESEGATAQNDNEPSQDAGGAIAEATPEPKGSREWRPEMEKEIRAESELESSATETLSKEMAEVDQIKPLSRHDREVLVSTRSKHRTAFILAAILFALVVAYAISKFRRDPGVTANTQKATAPRFDPATTINKPPSAPRPPPLSNPVREAAREHAAPPRPTIATAPPQQPPGAWVWTQYKGKI